MNKTPLIELMEFNTLMSLMDFFITGFEDKTINTKKIQVVQSYSDIINSYTSPALSIEILYRKNRSIGFGNYYGDIDNQTEIIEIEGTLFEYRVQLNVYSNTRGENYKWSSLLDDLLKNGEQGIPLNTYYDNGTIKQANIGTIEYDFSTDVKNNTHDPNINTHDFHMIYEAKMSALQQYRISYSPAELGNIVGEIDLNLND